MTPDQAILFILLVLVFVFLIWGRWRYDLVAFVALMLALLTGVVSIDTAFSGFGHPATIIIALVLVVSRGLSNSGVIELIARYVVDASRRLAAHIGIMSAVAASLSAVMNNVAALALLMPVDLQAARKADRSPSLSLMALSFASILGGMITLIGTPPNIVVAEIRNDSLGEPFRMFDFAPVGLACAAVGVAYVALIGWRLLPSRRKAADAGEELFDLADYIAEVRVPEGSAVIGKRVRERLLVATGCLNFGPPLHEGVLGAERAAVEHGLPYERLDAAAIAARFPALQPAESDVGIFEQRAGVLAPERCVAGHVMCAVRDGSGEAVLRLHEACGDRASITVCAARRIETAARASLLEDVLAREEVGDGIVALTLRPFELVTLRLGLAEA